MKKTAAFLVFLCTCFAALFAENSETVRAREVFIDGPIDVPQLFIVRRAAREAANNSENCLILKDYADGEPTGRSYIFTYYTSGGQNDNSLTEVVTLLDEIMTEYDLRY